ncbi:MAG: L-2-hydroxyglutarate oxidase [Verrucomicrobiota bacterium]
MSQTIGIIGAGLVGLATAHKLAKHAPSVRVVVFEKESAPGQHQSTHNSGVLHAGLYYKPGSAKARLAVSGLRQMLDFCQTNAVPYEQCGKLVLAVDAAELALLPGLFERGTANGLRGLRLLGPDEIREREPHARGVAAILVPEEGIVDYAKAVEVLTAQLRQSGHRVLTGWRVNRLERHGQQWIVHSTSGDEACDFIVNTAGLYCDRVSQMAGEPRDTRIIPFRGEYYQLRADRQHLVRHLIYPVPNPKFPFLGVHFTRLIHGGIEAGPNAVLAFAREGYRKSQVNVYDLADTLGFAGFWRFARRHSGMCWQELRQSFSSHRFATALQRLVPEIQPEDLKPGGAGVRAQAMRPDGSLVEDFQFIKKPGALHVLNAPSPAATASLAIADEILARIRAGFLAI